jgi:Arc/MetJ family transcription regulator
MTRLGRIRMSRKTPIEIDEEALRTAAEVLGTKTKKDTVNAALREVGQRLTRLSALARLGEMADRGDFDEFLDNKRAYRRWALRSTSSTPRGCSASCRGRTGRYGWSR